MQRFLLLALVLLAGCALPMRTRRTHTGGETRVGWKKVVDKRPPTWLVAADQAVCSVSASKYDHTSPGDVVLCAWHYE